MNIKQIIKKYNYPEDLANFLTIVYANFLKYFGEDKEDIIYEALNNTEIVLGDNIYETLNKRGLIDNVEGDSLVNEDDLKRAVGIYQSVPDIKYNLKTNTFEINSIKRLIAINAPDLSSNYSKSTLVHELGHLIKSYFKEYTIEENKLKSRNGLISREWQLTIKDGKIIKKLIKEEGIGLEEGLNTVLEEDIIRQIIDANYQATGYGVISSVARNIIKTSDIAIPMLNSQILNDKESIINIFEDISPNLYNNLECLMDKLYKLSLKMFSEIFDPEKMQETSKQIKEVLVKEYLPLQNIMTKSQEYRLGE